MPFDPNFGNVYMKIGSKIQQGKMNISLVQPLWNNIILVINNFRLGILHKPSASIKFWPKYFHKSSVIFDIFRITNFAGFSTFLVWQTANTRSTEHKIYLAITALFSPCTL